MPLFLGNKIPLGYNKNLLIDKKLPRNKKINLFKLFITLNL